MRNKIAVFEVESWERDAFHVLEPEHEVLYTSRPLRADVAAEYADADLISVFIHSDLDSDVLDQFENLRLIATRSTGFDHIDTDYCTAEEIVVANVPSYGDNTVAEHAIGLLLTISHHLRDALQRTQRGDFSLQGLQGFDLEDKILGVIGTGAIGRRVIEMANGFRMRVVAHDIVEDDDLAERLGFRYVDLTALLTQADIVTLHVPYNAKTHHLLDEQEFAQMKEGAVLLNTARGQIVNTRALMDALADGKVSAVGLDVLPEEPTIREEAELLRSVYRRNHDQENLLADHVLMRLRNVYITPHSAFYTREAVRRILDTTVENIQAFLAGNAQNVVA